MLVHFWTGSVHSSKCWLDFNDKSIINTCGVERILRFSDVREWNILCTVCQWYICSFTAFTRSHCRRRTMQTDSQSAAWLWFHEHAYLHSFNIIDTLDHSLLSFGHLSKCNQCTLFKSLMQMQIGRIEDTFYEMNLCFMAHSTAVFFRLNFGH